VSAAENLEASLILLQGLQRLGLRRLVLCPGSRSAALAVAAGMLAGPRLSLQTGIDERSAAFFALGLSRADGVPAAVITTSGTAVANLLPAVVELSLVIYSFVGQPQDILPSKILQSAEIQQVLTAVGFIVKVLQCLVHWHCRFNKQ